MDEIIFLKNSKGCHVTNYNSKHDLSNIKKMNDIVFEKYSNIIKLLRNGGTYKWIGEIEKKRTRFYAKKTKAILNI
jgi:hypothetical protein